MTIKYLTNSNGSKTAVVIPIKEWEKYNRNVNSLTQRLKLKHNIETGFSEIKSKMKNRKKLKTMSNFLNEL